MTSRELGLLVLVVVVVSGAVAVFIWNDARRAAEAAARRSVDGAGDAG